MFVLPYTLKTRFNIPIKHRIKLQFYFESVIFGTFYNLSCRVYFLSFRILQKLLVSGTFATVLLTCENIPACPSICRSDRIFYEIQYWRAPLTFGDSFNFYWNRTRITNFYTISICFCAYLELIAINIYRSEKFKTNIETHFNVCLVLFFLFHTVLDIP